MKQIHIRCVRRFPDILVILVIGQYTLDGIHFVAPTGRWACSSSVYTSKDTRALTELSALVKTKESVWEIG